MCSRLLPILFFSILITVLPQTNSFSQSKIASGFRSERRTDDDLLLLPLELEELSLRGSRGYGADNVTDAGIAYLTKYPRLRVLRAGGLGLTDQCFQAIGKLSELEELSLDSNEITGIGIEHLLRLPKLRKPNLFFNPLNAEVFATLTKLIELQELRVAGHGWSVDDKMLEYCSTLSKLETLQLAEYSTGVTDRGLKSFARLPLLKGLSLKGAKQITGDGLRAVGTLTKLESLELYDLNTVEPGSLVWITNLAELRHLAIAQVRLNSSDVRAITSLPKVEQLMLWNIFSNENERSALDNLAGLRHLKELRTNESLSRTAIANLADCEDLESIADGLTEISDTELASLSTLPKLHTLCLDSDSVSELSLPSLAKMRSLRTLFVTSRVRLTDQQLRSLGEDSLLECQIQRMYPPYTVIHKAQVRN